MKNKTIKLSVGITGQAGFIGTHLFNYLGLQENIERIPFSDAYFEQEDRLVNFVRRCDVIVHLAAVNRHTDSEILYNTNVALVEKLVSALKASGNRPHVIFSSSIQEKRNNVYGNSKKEGRRILMEWARKYNASFTGMIIPNVFGPFGQPFYNSVIATFSHQMVNNQAPKIEIDVSIPLIYINDLIAEIYKVISNGQENDGLAVRESCILTVTDILKKLMSFKDEYLKLGVIPDLSDYMDQCLFNTFRSYLPENVFPRKYDAHKDDRGQFVELVKTFNTGQTSFSTTRPGITRGNHFHIRKVERFMVIRGEAEMQLRRIGTNNVLKYRLTGDEPSYVDIPIWYTHNITNTGADDLYTVFWINECFDSSDPDTFFEQVITDVVNMPTC